MLKIHPKDALVLTADGTPINREILDKIRTILPERLLIAADRNGTLYSFGEAPPHIPPILSEIYQVTQGGLVILTNTAVNRNDRVFGIKFPVIGGSGAERRLTPEGEIERISPDEERMRQAREAIDSGGYFPVYEKTQALQKAITDWKPWQDRVLIGFGDDPELDGNFLQYISKMGGYAFAVKKPTSEAPIPIPGTLAMLKDTNAVIALLLAVFYERIQEPNCLPRELRVTTRKSKVNKKPKP